ncbi:MAG TPA: tetratricopeptide repeat protein [Stellaceae bacterium]|nr:tetratricopeptide repeat protein [Stellaceae bacterium]
MRHDERGLPLSTDSAEAAALFDRAVEHYLKFHADVPVLVGSMLAADPDFVMGHCLKGYLLLSAANPANKPEIAKTLAAAEAGAAALTGRERLHVAAFSAWAQDRLDRAYGIWRQILDDNPTDLLAARICDTMWFRHGQTAKILEQADRLLPAWSAELPGYDCFQTLWAFAHEEAGDTTGAEPAVDEAVAQDPSNYFAHHVKAHVMEMECRPREGREWLAAQAAHWSLGNNLIHHLWWHRALMELELGEFDAVLASYDENIRNLNSPMTRAMPDHYVDLQNAPAVLWRLEQCGVAVGERWQELADKAEARAGEAGHPLLVPHLMMALAATGRGEAAERFLAALRALAEDGSYWNAEAVREVVIPVCEAALAHRRGEYGRVVDLLEPRQQQIRLLGGSNAQRDLFFQMLIDAAVKAGRRDTVTAMVAHEARTRSVPPAQRIGYAAATRWLG